jgi:hypothetical protein
MGCDSCIMNSRLQKVSHWINTKELPCIRDGRAASRRSTLRRPGGSERAGAAHGEPAG